MDYESQRVAFWCFYEDRLAEFYQRLQQTQKRAVPNRHKGLYRTPRLGKDIIAYKIRLRRQRSISKMQDLLKRDFIRHRILPYIRPRLAQGRNFLREWLKRRSNFAR